MGKKTLLIFSLLLLCCRIAEAAENFSNINGQDYYQILQAERSADTAALRRSYRRLMAIHHPDIPTGDENISKSINRAFEVLSDPDLRRQYDSWLSAGANESQSTVSGSGQSHAQTAEEIREETFRTMAVETQRAVEQERRLNPQASMDQLSEMARLVIIYNQRWLPMAQLRDEDLMRIFVGYTLRPDEALTASVSNDALYALAGGATKILQERSAQSTINDIRRELEWSFQTWREPGQQQYIDRLWTILTGASYLARGAASAPQCGRTFNATFTDAQGRTWNIPINVEIKLGQLNHKFFLFW